MSVNSLIFKNLVTIIFSLILDDSYFENITSGKSSFDLLHGLCGGLMDRIKEQTDFIVR